MKHIISSLLTALLLVVGFTSSASAQTLLRQIGTNSFTGSHHEACDLHVEAHGLFSMQDCLTAIVKSDDAEICPERAVLQEGTVWWMLFTKGGEHKIGLHRIAFGTHVPEDDPMRMANDCTGVAGAKNFIWPHACGNYAVPGQSHVPQQRQTTKVTPRPQEQSSGFVSSTHGGSSLIYSSTIYRGAPIQMCANCCN